MQAFHKYFLWLAAALFCGGAVLLVIVGWLAACAEAGISRVSKFRAEEAARANMTAVTIWVDASWGFRNQGAANALSKAHQAFASRGYQIVDVAPYIENGDLQGFFVTYRKP